jgi:hypothetical protein
MHPGRRFTFKTLFATLYLAAMAFAAAPSLAIGHKSNSAHHAAANSALSGVEAVASLLLVLAVIVLVVALYMLPTIIAKDRRHRNVLPIALVNIFAGFTLLGWFAAFVWSLTADVHDPVRR